VLKQDRGAGEERLSGGALVGGRSDQILWWIGLGA
jgi:hypothetical protein